LSVLIVTRTNDIGSFTCGPTNLILYFYEIVTIVAMCHAIINIVVFIDEIF